MKKFEIENCPSKKDIKEMIELDNMSFSEQDRGDLNKCLKWQQICPDIYTAIKFDKKIIGYINFVAITKACYDKTRAGNLKDYELRESDILPFKQGKNYCLFMSALIEKNFQNKEAVILLSKAFFEKINNMKQRGIVFDDVICDCVSKDGEKFVKRNFRAKPVCNSKTGTIIYEFKL